jgi:putative membrane protein
LAVPARSEGSARRPAGPVRFGALQAFRGNGHRYAEVVAVTVQVGEARDATRRTQLANERTYLAWWRTGLTSLAVSFGAGRLVPELAGGPSWPFEVIGVAFAVVGITFMTYGYIRHRNVDAALSRGDYTSLPSRAAVIFAGLGGLLGLATILLVVLHPK